MIGYMIAICIIMTVIVLSTIILGGIALAVKWAVVWIVRRVTDEN